MSQGQESVRTFVDAMNIHVGGGATLLDGFLAGWASPINAVLLVDSRYVFAAPLPEGLEVRLVSPSLSGRFRAARWIAATARRGDRLICLGNLPPLFPVRCEAVLYIQNRYVVDKVPLSGFPLAVATRLRLERLWLRLRAGDIERFVVQTVSMRRLLEDAGLTRDRLVDVLPFVGPIDDTPVAAVRGDRAGFIYVASGEPHKNHLVLIEAWSLLAAEGYFPQLRLTLDPAQFPQLMSAIESARTSHGVDVVNLGQLPRKALAAEYARAGALVYPSSFESFGMPLIEAQQGGLPIIAPELDYVRDVVVPVESFDARSALSLSRAVKRFMGLGEQPAAPLSPVDFVNRLLGIGGNRGDVE